MSRDLYVVNAFTQNNRLFSGSPAAVCPLPQFLPDTTLQAISAQNNLPETAFIVFQKNQVMIRWFAPNGEVKLCGHATLAAAYVIFHFLQKSWKSICFSSLSGELSATNKDGRIELDFPARHGESVSCPDLLYCVFRSERTLVSVCKRTVISVLLER